MADVWADNVAGKPGPNAEIHRKLKRAWAFRRAIRTGTTVIHRPEVRRPVD
jgi:hypothetical protein